MSILITKLTGIRGGLASHIVAEFTTTFDANGEASVECKATNQNETKNEIVSVSKESPLQQIELNGLVGTLQLHPDCSAVTFRGNITWGGQMEVVMEPVVVAVN